MKKEEMMLKATQMLAKGKFKLKKAGPTIMIVGAAIGGVTAAVLACKATLKAEEIIAEHKACNIRPTAKSTDFTKKKELWKVFRKNRKELFAYTVRGEGEDEEEATISLLAYENHCNKSAIYVTLEMR